MLAHQQTGGSTFDRAPGHGPTHAATTSLRTIHLAPQRARAVPWWAGANTPDGTLRKLQRKTTNTTDGSNVPPSSKSPSSPRQASSPIKRAPQKVRAERAIVSAFHNRSTFLVCVDFGGACVAACVARGHTHDLSATLFTYTSRSHSPHE